MPQSAHQRDWPPLNCSHMQPLLASPPPKFLSVTIANMTECQALLSGLSVPQQPLRSVLAHYAHFTDEKTEFESEHRPIHSHPATKWPKAGFKPRSVCSTVHRLPVVALDALCSRINYPWGRPGLGCGRYCKTGEDSLSGSHLHWRQPQPCH